MPEPTSKNTRRQRRRSRRHEPDAQAGQDHACPSRAGRERGGLLVRLVSRRRALQLLLGLTVYLAVERLGVPLLWVLGFGSVGGLLLGKFFCRWMCPLGFVMETLLGLDPSGRGKGMYQYFKVGCPIAWAGGLLNRVSLLRVKANANPCASCERCDVACYIATHNPEYSLWREGAKNPSKHYACSRCLSCVGACPTGKITVGLSLGERDAA